VGDEGRAVERRRERAPAVCEREGEGRAAALQLKGGSAFHALLSATPVSKRRPTWLVAVGIGCGPAEYARVNHENRRGDRVWGHADS